MGCAPPEKRHKSIPPVNAVPNKNLILSPRQSEQSKNSTQANQNNLLQVPLPKLPSNETLKSQRKQSKPERPNLKSRESLQSPQRFSYEHRDSPEKPMEKEIIRIVSPRDKLKSPKKIEEDNISKVTSVHSLDIVSKIKTPKPSEQALKAEKGKKTEEMTAERPQPRSSKVQQVNITFNSNDFAVAESKGKPTRRGGWRQQALLKQLQNINSENFKRITVNSRSFE